MSNTETERAKALRNIGPSSIVTVDNVPAEDVVSLKVYVDSVQTGSGDPSPTNVRPISGWTGAKVTRTGKNFGYFPPTDRSEVSGVAFSVSNGELSISGTASANANPNNASRVMRYESMPLGPYPAGTYTIKSTGFIGQNTNDRIVCSARYADNTAILDSQRISGSVGSIPDGSGRAVTFTATKPFKVGFWLSVTSGTSIDCNVKLMMNLGTNPESYEPYNGNTYDITFSTEAGTVYGGTLDVTTGLLTVERGNIASYAGETLPGAWISSMDVYTAGGAPTTGAQVVYELATPITYQLTPTQIALLAGMNNVWADCGDVLKMRYWSYDLLLNKVVYDNNILIDLTGDTITPEVMLAGYTAHDATGSEIEGSIEIATMAEVRTYFGLS